MAVNLTADTEHQIRQRLRTGAFVDADQLIQAGLRALDEQEEVFDPETIEAIRRAEDQLERGEGQEVAQVAAALRAGYPR